MKKQYTLALLGLGVTQAATPGPLPQALSYPLFATTAPPSGAGNVDSDDVKLDYMKLNSYI